MHTKIDHRSGYEWASDLLVRLRRRAERHADQALAEQLTPDLRADIGLSENGELLVSEKVGPAPRSADGQRWNLMSSGST